jgi:uncharacterized glyoxalase superfamily protein PhnB
VDIIRTVDYRPRGTKTIMTTAQPDALVHQIWPLLVVEDIERSIEFYRDQLGFSLVGRAEWKGKLYWCRVERGGACLMLQQAEADEDGPAGERGRGVVFYFICEDADAMYRDLTGRGLELNKPSIADYGMKQLAIPEPDGYNLCFESPTDNWTG